MFATFCGRIETMTSKIAKGNTEYVPRRELTLTERVEIIGQHEKGIRTGLVAQHFECSRQQIRRIINRKDDYLQLWAKSTNEEAFMVRRLRTPLLIATGRILYEWVLRARNQMSITDEILRQAGQRVAAHINYKDFKSNNRWLYRFKTKYKLNNLKMKTAHMDVLDTGNFQSLDLDDIIETIRRNDPASMAEFDKQPVEEDAAQALCRGYLSSQTQTKNKTLDQPSVKNEPLALLERFVGQAGNEHSRQSSCSSFDPAMNVDHDERLVDVLLESSGMDDTEYAHEITTYKEAINMLGPLEQFILLKENIRAVGLINQLEILFRDEMAKESS